MQENQNNSVIFHSLQEATGEIPYNMTNDYMFRAVLQSNNKVLCGLIRSLLHVDEDTPLSAEITNPIVLGESITDKEFRLDINVTVNNILLLNLEMQITNNLNWKNRSISYLCRSFVQINRGEDYSDIKPVIHIGFLNYTLFKENPEFYASYKLMNAKNHTAYSDNFNLRVVDLTQIHLATEEDKKYQIDYWASLFKSKTWEELRMIAENNEYMKEASKTIFQLSADELVQKRCRDREEYYDDIRSYQHALEKQASIIKEKDNTISQKDAEIESLHKQIAELKAKQNNSN